MRAANGLVIIWVICLFVRNSHWKRWVMPDVISHFMVACLKAGNLRILSQRDKPISYQLVGEVMAHQGLRVVGLRG